MNGARSAFFKVDSGIRRTVKFGDGSVVEIEGRGTILFLSKGGEHRKLTDVYFIPRLKANLVSLGQLDETSCFISIERGLLKIYENQRQLLTQVRRTTNRFYILELEDRATRQKQGVDFEEVFAPVARLKFVRLLLAIVAHYSWEIHHMDVKSAFLNGELKDDGVNITHAEAIWILGTFRTSIIVNN